MKDEIEYLRNLPKNWWMNQNTCVIVASTLEQYGYFNDKRQVISFFEKPYNYQSLVDDLIRDFKDD